MECLAEMALEILQHKQGTEPRQPVTGHMIDRYILPAFYGEWILVGLAHERKRLKPSMDILSSIIPVDQVTKRSRTRSESMSTRSYAMVPIWRRGSQDSGSHQSSLETNSDEYLVANHTSADRSARSKGHVPPLLADRLLDANCWILCGRVDLAFAYRIPNAAIGAPERRFGHHAANGGLGGTY